MQFKFKAKTKDGEVKRGKIDAVDKEMATQLLQKNDLIPLQLKEIKQNESMSGVVERMTSSVNQKDMLLFYREFATLVGAKIPIAPALKTIHEQTENAQLRTVVLEIASDVEDGMSISESFAKHENVFTTLAVSMIRAGEVSGNLQGAIEFVAESAEQNYQLKSKIRGALMYPIFVISVAGVIGFLTMTWILPKLTGVIVELDVEIPWYTNVMIKIGDFMQAYWWAVIIVIVGVIVASIYYIRSEDGSKEWDRIKLKLPVIGKLFKYVYITRFTENLSVLLKGGIPIVKALIIVADVVDNIVYKNIILKAAQDVKKGGEINAEFFKHDEFPPMVSSMIKIGEETGRLGEILEDIARFYNAEVDQITRNLSSIIEPILIVVLGIGVGVLVFSVLLPIYNIAGQL
ncbi:MAG: type II secretion system F family protein [Patescibacteria group bacterium]|nr:type II secretion system F family protein [Patescibacteria group bacterium]